MTNVARRPLTSKMRSTLTTRFLRVPREPKSWLLSRGYGVAFPTCWNGQKTMLHLSDGDCPNCNRGTSGVIGSFHPVKSPQSRVFGNLFLPDKPTRRLLELSTIDWDSELLELTTARRGPGPGLIQVDAEAVPRIAPLSPSQRDEAEQHIVRQVLRYFLGLGSISDGERMILSWSSADVLLG